MVIYLEQMNCRKRELHKSIVDFIYIVRCHIFGEIPFDVKCVLKCMSFANFNRAYRGYASGIYIWYNSH
jgi:hypothetical protein